jgi:ferredoxin-NADP reductase
LRVRIVQIDKVAWAMRHLMLAPINGQRLAPFVAGSHIKVEVPKFAGVKAGAFSLTGSAHDAHVYQILVRHTRNQSSVACWLHDEAKPGEIVDVSEPRCGLELYPQAAHHCLVAGGSGISAFLSHLDALHRDEDAYELHYAFKDRREGIWCDDLRACHGQRFRQYVSTEGERLDFNRLLSAQPPGAHVYVCGPPRLLQSAVDAARPSNFPAHAIHWDAYGWRPRIEGGERAGRASPARKEWHSVRNQTRRQRIPKPVTAGICP